MFLYELAVDEAHRRQGIGTALVEALRDLAREHGCYGMWVLTDDDNAAAGATYRKAGGEVESQPLMFSWRFLPPAPRVSRRKHKPTPTRRSVMRPLIAGAGD